MICISRFFVLYRYFKNDHLQAIFSSTATMAVIGKDQMCDPNHLSHKRIVKMITTIILTFVATQVDLF